nr:type II toxin-antitoxin system RelE/ParE family toxin [Mesorhizobium sp. M9A.F.Ca.ET.002.03.1.2]
MSSSRGEPKKISRGFQRKTSGASSNSCTKEFSAHPNPRALAKRLTGTKEEAWRFRVGDYRIIAQFQDSRLVVLVVEIGNRREVYR